MAVFISGLSHPEQRPSPPSPRSENTFSSWINKRKSTYTLAHVCTHTHRHTHTLAIYSTNVKIFRKEMGHINACGCCLRHLCPQLQPAPGGGEKNVELSGGSSPEEGLTPGASTAEPLALSPVPAHSLPAVTHLMMSFPKRKWNHLFLYELLGPLNPEGSLRNREIIAARNLILEM